MTNTEKKEKKNKKKITSVSIDEETIELLENKGIGLSKAINKLLPQFWINLKELEETRDQNRYLTNQNREILRKYYSTNELLKKYTGEK